MQRVGRTIFIFLGVGIIFLIIFLIVRIKNKNMIDACHHQASAITKEAIYYLQFRLVQHHHNNTQKLAIIMQAEQVVASNLNSYFLTVYKFSKIHHIAVFFVTALTVKEKNLIIANLNQNGFRKWDGLYFKFKSEQPKEIAQKGYDIIALPHAHGIMTCKQNKETNFHEPSTIFATA